MKDCVAAAYFTTDGPQGVSDAANYVAALFEKNQDGLEQTIDTWNTKQCEFDDGRPWLAGVREGYAIDFHPNSNWSRSEGLNLINKLKARNPKSAVGATAEVEYWIDYAWDARGTGLSSSVTPDGWRLFQERLTKAEKVLISTKPYASNLPIWYDQMIVVQSALDRSPADRDKIFLEGAGKYKTFYPTYFTMLNFLSPKWGGSWGAVDNFVAWSVENTKSTEGNAMYARLYWAAYGGLLVEQKLFRDSYVSWPKMKKGFEDMMTRHPKSLWNLNNFAKFSCLAGDKKTFIALRRQIGSKVMDEAWTGDASLELCENKFSYVK